MAPAETQVTPRDVKSTEPAANGVVTSQSPSNFRYRGYPDESFEKSRHPITLAERGEEKLYGDFTDAKHNRRQQFDKVKPRAYGTERNTFLFSSDQLPSNEIKAKPITGALMEKSEPERESQSAQYRRFSENKSIAAGELHQMKLRRQAELTAKKEEQRLDSEQMDSYNPWGKGGGGAPNSQDHKKHVFQETDLETRAGITPRPNAYQKDLLEEHGDFYEGFGRPGGGAALRTKSGNVKTELKADQDIRFQNTTKGRNINDIEARYKPKSPSQHLEYSQTLDHLNSNIETQILERRLREQLERKENQDTELRMLQHNPYGKPGAGAPNATKSGTHNIRRILWNSHNPTEQRRIDSKSTVQVRRCNLDQTVHGPLFKHKKSHPAIRRCKDQDIKALEQSKSTEIEGVSYNPWGQGFGNPDYNEHGDAKGSIRAEHYKGGVHTRFTPLPDTNDPDYGILDLQKSRGGGGAPNFSESGKILTRREITMRKNDFGEGIIREKGPDRDRAPRVDDDDERQVYDPYGKPGAGAPQRDPKGNIKTTTTGNFNDLETYVKRLDPRKKFISDDIAYASQNEIEISRQNRQRNDREIKFGGGELATEMMKFQTGRPRQDPNTGHNTNNHLGTSDVTRERVNARDPKAAQQPEVREYHSDLVAAAERRERKKVLDRFKEQQEAHKHADSMSQFWGRPGGGAPKGDNRKQDLDYIVYSSRKQNGEQGGYLDRHYGEYRPSKSEPAQGAGQLDFYQKQTSHDSPRDGSNYIKNTSGSSAYNGYQVEPISRKQTYQQASQNMWNRPMPYAAYNNYEE